MTIPTLFQTHPITNSYWMCGNDVLLKVLPNRWIGLCALVRMKTSVVLVYDRVNKMLGLDVEKGRVKRSSGNYIIDKRVYVAAIGQPRGIPFEFKATQ